MMRLFPAAAGVVFFIVTDGLCQSAVTPVGSISGRVTLGGRPVQDARVTLVQVEGGPMPPSSKPLAAAVTDSDGHFLVESVPASRYIVNAFAPALFGSSEKVVAVDQGEAVGGIDVTLQRGGVITGRVADQRGQPVVNVVVDVIELDGAGRPRRPSVQNIDSSICRTDDRGMYRIYGLAPGRYKVAVGMAPGSSVIRFPQGFYLRTYHPDAHEETSATIIQVAAGTEASDVDITVAFARTYSASGRIVDARTGEPKAGLLYGYGAVGEDGKFDGSVGVVNPRSTSKGEFLIKGLLPGRYAAFAVKEEEDDGDTYSEPVAFDLGSADVSGIEIKLHHGASISGTVVIE